MTAESAPAEGGGEIRRSRGDRQRDAIVAAVRELLHERSFADLSVSTISERAGVARSGFYFYFDSKYAVLAVILADASELLDSLTHHFAPREPGETPFEFAKRMVGSAAAVYANDDPVLTACAVARNTDAQIREMMDDFYDGIIDKLVTPPRAGRRRAADLRRPARPGAHAGGDDHDDADARQRVRRPRHRPEPCGRRARAAVGGRDMGWLRPAQRIGQ